LKSQDRNYRVLRGSVIALLLCLVALPAHARRRSESWARSQFATAERMREALNGRPAKERTQRQYQRAIEAYRRVYYGAPASTKADPSVVAVAELMVEEGRQFENDRILRSAIGQYQFLRREYPGSKYRFDALFTIGEIYKDDLDDPAKARASFREFLKRYPRHHLAAEAREALAEPTQEATRQAKQDQDKEVKNDAAENDSAGGSRAAADSKPGKLPRVTSIRHWSTPDYTRVAIDLEQDVKFESQRIDSPDRIFFDLYDTKLASTLVGKTFDVDDGFLKKIRVAQFQPGRTRVVLEVDDLSDYDAFLLPNPSRLIIDIHGKQEAKAASAKDETSAAKAAPSKQDDSEIAPDTVTTKSAKQITPAVAATDEDDVETKSTVKPAVASKSAPKKKIVEADDEDEVEVVKLEPPAIKPVSKPADPPRVTPAPPASDRAPSRAKGKGKLVPPEPDVHEAQPNASGDRSLIRALGLKIGKIVIDPGHGGHDTGTIGPNGLEEKDLVLDVGRRLGKLLESRLGAEVVYTRKDDTFIPLETRTAIANQEQADLFVSVHANSSDDPDARGVETYYLNFTSSPEALEVAARENAVSEKSIHELQDLVKKIALKEKIEESREFATDVQHSLHSGLAAKSPGIRDRGVKKAPFIVLIGANMPSILAEVSFVSNPTDERKLGTGDYRQRIAESLFRGISKYVSGLSGVKVASRLAKSEGQ
jgi:N-acetylmuramoyl-L-alanine amidase